MNAVTTTNNEAMKPNRLFVISALLLALSTLNPQLSTLFAQGTTFSVQGRLNNNGTPANGLYDLRLSVYSAASGGTLIAGPITLAGVDVDNGVFSVTPDFGAGVFTGPGRWLEMGFTPTGNGNFSPLPERQAVLAAPYAIFAGTAADVVNGTVVKSLNGLHDHVTLAAGANVTITPNGNTLTIAATGSGNGLWSVNGTSAYYNGGNVGIGTDFPAAKLEVDGDWNGTDGALTLGGELATLKWVGGYGSFPTFHKSEWLAQADTSGGLSFWNRHWLAGTPPGYSWYAKLTKEGSMTFGSRHGQHLMLWGDGTTGLTFGFGIQNQTLYTRCGSNLGDGFAWYKGGLHNDAKGNAGGGQALMTLDEEQGLYVRKGFIVDGPSNLRGDATLWANATIGGDATVLGNASVCTLAIRGGCDLAEPFPMAQEQIEKGAVVVIDEEHPGQLARSTRAYDTRVAGIVSGANGIRPGISLKQEGVLDQGENVALTGRVYVQADAAYGAIKPGDLLTTSDTPGHAMKVTDHARAQGAVLGKAMSVLDVGKGMVLVLVTLQ